MAPQCAPAAINDAVLPIDFWRKINCEDETEYLLSSTKNKERLFEALNRTDSLSKEEVYARIGL